MRRSLVSGSLTLLGLLVAIGSTVSRAEAQNFEFATPPGTQTNMIYRIDPATGEMGACTYAANNGVGLTQCFGAGEGAAAQAQGNYHLVATHFATEGGVFRVNQTTGEMSICYLRATAIVCTPMAK